MVILKPQDQSARYCGALSRSVYNYIRNDWFPRSSGPARTFSSTLAWTPWMFKPHGFMPKCEFLGSRTICDELLVRFLMNISLVSKLGIFKKSIQAWIGCLEGISFLLDYLWSSYCFKLGGCWTRLQGFDVCLEAIVYSWIRYENHACSSLPPQGQNARFVGCLEVIIFLSDSWCISLVFKLDASDQRKNNWTLNTSESFT